MKTILNALKQESTWRGIIAIATALGIQLAPELQAAIITLGLSVIGGINVLKRD